MRGLSFLIPFRCPLCGGGLPSDGTDNMFCFRCLKHLPMIAGTPCKVCGGKRTGLFEICPDCLEAPKRPWTNGWALFQYEDLVPSVIRLFKYGNRTDLARPLGRLAAGCIPEGRAWDAVTFVPLHWIRSWSRGYNQAELLAQEFVRNRGGVCRDLLKRVRNTSHQAFLKKEERLKNLSGAFSVRRSQFVENRSILLIDDVMTTGATLAEAAETLLKAGAASVDVLAAARRQRI